MGLLDDAIREHLELKRRRGADPGEVAREQHEALDPIVRESIATAEDDVVVDEAHEQRAEQPYDLPEAGVTAGGVPEDMPDDFADARHAPGASEAAALGETAELDMRTVLGDGPTPSVAGGVRPTPGAGTPLAGDTPTAQGDSLDWEMPGHETDAKLDDEPDEDVLEETPDFLRDTPEQDRLWFEQRPPRDFDFDK
jgi:hypothetical protein